MLTTNLGANNMQTPTMCKAYITVLLTSKRLPWLVLANPIKLNSDVYAAELPPATAISYGEPSLYNTLTELIKHAPLNLIAWLSLTALMAILFFRKNPIAS